MKARNPEEFKAKLHGALSEPKYFHRSVDGVSRQIGEDPSVVLRWCREKPDTYTISVFRDGLYIGLKDRVDAKLKEEEEALNEAMEGGESDDGAKVVEEAKLKPIRKMSQVRTDWEGIGNTLAHTYICLTRTLRLLPYSEEAVLLEQTIRDLETLHDRITKKSQKSAK